jgi:hypothetical protein
VRKRKRRKKKKERKRKRKREKGGERREREWEREREEKREKGGERKERERMGEREGMGERERERENGEEREREKERKGERERKGGRERHEGALRLRARTRAARTQSTISYLGRSRSVGLSKRQVAVFGVRVKSLSIQLRPPFNLASCAGDNFKSSYTASCLMSCETRVADNISHEQLQH